MQDLNKPLSRVVFQVLRLAMDMADVIRETDFARIDETARQIFD